MRCFCFFNATATTEYYTDLHTLALHDPLPISDQRVQRRDLLLRRSPPDGPLLHVHRRAQAPAGAVGHLRPWLGHDVQRQADGGQSHAAQCDQLQRRAIRSEEPTSELQSLMRSSYAVFFLKKKKEHKATSR